MSQKKLQMFNHLINSKTDKPIELNDLRKYQGYLLKKRRKMLGFRKHFVVLYMGNIIYYKNEFDAKNDLDRCGTYSLKNSFINEYPHKQRRTKYLEYSFTINLKNGKWHTLCTLPFDQKSVINQASLRVSTNSISNSSTNSDAIKFRERKKKWIHAVKEHIQFAMALQDFEHGGNKLNSQIEKVENQLNSFKKKLDDTRLSYKRYEKTLELITQENNLVNDESTKNNLKNHFRQTFENISPSESSDEDEIESDLDSQIDSGSQFDVYFDTAEDFAELNNPASDESTENTSGRDSGFSRSETNNVKIIEPQTWRKCLPAKMMDRSKISIWSIAKQLIGKEFSKMSPPAVLCEPLSFLQRVGESAQHTHLLYQAVEHPDAGKRMEYVAAYAFTLYCSIERAAIPFIPLLGETFELIREDLGYKFIAEQVSSQPPTFAFHADPVNPNETNWKFYGSFSWKIKFWGRSVEIEPKGFFTIEFPALNEAYTWSPIKFSLHSVILGPVWVEHFNNVEIICNRTGYKTILNVKPYSPANKETNIVDGFIFDNNMKKIKAVYGFWSKCFYSCDPDSYENYIRTNKKLPTTALTKEMPSIQSEPKIENENHKATSNSVQSSLNLTEIPHQNNSQHKSKRSKSNELTQKEADLNFGSLSEIQSDIAINRNMLTPKNANNSPSVSSKHGNLTFYTMQLKDLKELWRLELNQNPDYYWFSLFSISLNELKPEFEKVIAPTDSRFRPDIRNLEMGNIDEANKEKTRVEEKQRERERAKMIQPKWFNFTNHALLSEDVWMFNNKYWSRDYKDCPNLY